MYRIFIILSTLQPHAAGTLLAPSGRADGVESWHDRVHRRPRLYRHPESGQAGMIEFIRLNDYPVRLTGFRRSGPPERPVFEIVVQIPGDAAERDFVPLLAPPRLTLTLLHPDGREEEYLVTITDRHLHTAGPPHARLFRHQLRLEPVPADAPVSLDPIGEELAALLARFNRLLDMLEAAGIVSRAAVEGRAEELGGEG